MYVVSSPSSHGVACAPEQSITNAKAKQSELIEVLIVRPIIETSYGEDRAISPKQSRTKPVRRAAPVLRSFFFCGDVVNDRIWLTVEVASLRYFRTKPYPHERYW